MVASAGTSTTTRDRRAARSPAILVAAWVLASGASLQGLGAQGPSVLSGRVSGPDGLPVQGAVVAIEGGGLSSVTDAEGRYRISGVRAGRLRLVASAPGYRPFETLLEIAREGESVRRDLRLVGEPLRMPEVLTRVERPAPPGRWMLRRADLAEAGSLARALARVPGVFVVERGAGGPVEVSIRGAATDQTLVLWGEERVLAPAGGAVDLRTLPSAAVDSVEVVQTGASSRYGAGALGGVVRIHPAAATPVRRPALAVAGEIASLGMGGASARLLVPAGALAVRLDAAARSYADDFGERANAGGSEGQAALALRAPGPGLSLDVAAFRSDRGAPGPVYDPTPRAELDSHRLLAEAAIQRGAGPALLRGEASLQLGEVRFADPDRPALRGDSRESALALRAAMSGPTGAHRLEAGLEARRHAIDGSDLAGRPERLELGLYAGDRWQVSGVQGLTVAPSVRLDRIVVRPGDPAGHEDAANETLVAALDRSDLFLSPAFSAVLKVGGALALRAQAGRSFRYPGFQTLFFLPGVGVRSNPDLREERSRDLELAADWSPFHGLSTSAAAFDRRLDGAIVWLPDFRFVWSPRNLPRAVVRGFDLTVAWASRGSWEATAAYTYAPARFDFPGNRNPLPYRPAHIGRLELARREGPLRSAVEARLTGRRYPNLAGTNALDADVVADWSAEWRGELAGRAVALGLRVENLLDRRYDVVFGFPEGGRSVSASVRYGPP